MTDVRATIVTDDDRHGDSRERIIDAATALFVRDGYRATSLKAIAEQVGMSPPALYWHFESKQHLFLASMEHLLETFMASVEARLTGATPPALLRQFVTAHAVWKLEQREAAGAYTMALGMRDIVHTLSPRHRRSLVAKQRRHLDRLRGILDAGVAGGAFVIEDIRVTAFAIITLCEHVQSWYDPTGELSPDDVAERYAELVLAMVRAG
ncbi:MAG TPA: TetR/AcrR family transcriptional regulator [Baekduia sp.]|uniref:TetR/AcrR family transcriptional regulator n=1 Tax=Baekduia sp. TaxID=2600305 RepID=UPI002D76E98B|nr:TetR/AcrR family transcriptional regulator [Baekduia sp.]HET6509111.1 TetR/AcrR family transcriptional regulator [Baekduia sp.]